MDVPFDTEAERAALAQEIVDGLIHSALDLGKQNEYEEAVEAVETLLEGGPGFPDPSKVLVERDWLRGIEWTGALWELQSDGCVRTSDDATACPVCEQTMEEGHAPDCWLDAAIGSADGD